MYGSMCMQSLCACNRECVLVSKYRMEALLSLRVNTACCFTLPYPGDSACMLLSILRTPIAHQFCCIVCYCADLTGQSSDKTLECCSFLVTLKCLWCSCIIHPSLRAQNEACKTSEFCCNWAPRCECGQPCNLATAAAVGPLCQAGACSHLHHAAHAGHGTLQVPAGPAWHLGLAPGRLLHCAGLLAQVPG